MTNKLTIRNMRLAGAIQVGTINVSLSITTGPQERFDLTWDPTQDFVIVTEKATGNWSVVPFSNIISLTFKPETQLSAETICKVLSDTATALPKSQKIKDGMAKARAAKAAKTAPALLPVSEAAKGRFEPSVSGS